MAVLGGEEGRGFSQDLLLHPEHAVLPRELDQLLPLGRGQALPVALVDVRLGEPVEQAALADANVGSDLAIGLAPSRASSTSRRRNSGG